MLLGLAIPALVDGLCRSSCPKVALAFGLANLMSFAGFQPDTRNAIPGYDGLLFVYSLLLVPVLFSLLVGLNILVWSRARINYVFIFGKSSLVSA